METKTLPAGTTQEQWDRYEADVKAHEEFIKNYKFFLDRIVTYLEWQSPRINKPSFTPAEIKDFVGSEIFAAQSMDAPNPPNYEFANND